MFACILSFTLIMVGCDQKQLQPVGLNGPVDLITPVTSTPSPDNQVMSALFDDLSFVAKDSQSVDKSFRFQYRLSGQATTVSLKSDIRYFIAKDTGSTVTIRINHGGKEFLIDEGAKIKLSEVRSFTFLESMVCDSIGRQDYLIRVTIKNKHKAQFTQFTFDSWDIALIKKD